MKKRVQAQRKFAQGAYIPPSVNERRNDAPIRDAAEAQKQPNVTYSHMSASNLLDMVSMKNINPPSLPMVVVKRLPDNVNANMSTQDLQTIVDNLIEKNREAPKMYKVPQLKAPKSKNTVKRTKRYVSISSEIQLRSRSVIYKRPCANQVIAIANRKNIKILNKIKKRPLPINKTNMMVMRKRSASHISRSKSPPTSEFSTDDETPLYQISRKRPTDPQVADNITPKRKNITSKSQNPKTVCDSSQATPTCSQISKLSNTNEVYFKEKQKAITKSSATNVTMKSLDSNIPDKMHKNVDEVSVESSVFDNMSIYSTETQSSMYDKTEIVRWINEGNHSSSGLDHHAVKPHKEIFKVPDRPKKTRAKVSVEPPVSVQQIPPPAINPNPTDVSSNVTPTEAINPNPTEVSSNVTPTEAINPNPTDVSSNVTQTEAINPNPTDVSSNVTPTEAINPNPTEFSSNVTPTEAINPNPAEVSSNVTPSEASKTAPARCLSYNYKTYGEIQAASIDDEILQSFCQNCTRCLRFTGTNQVWKLLNEKRAESRPGSVTSDVYDFNESDFSFDLPLSQFREDCRKNQEKVVYMDLIPNYFRILQMKFETMHGSSKPSIRARMVNRSAVQQLMDENNDKQIITLMEQGHFFEQLISNLDEELNTNMDITLKVANAGTQEDCPGTCASVNEANNSCHVSASDGNLVADVPEVTAEPQPGPSNATPNQVTAEPHQSPSNTTPMQVTVEPKPGPSNTTRNLVFAEPKSGFPDRNHNVTAEPQQSPLTVTTQNPVITEPQSGLSIRTLKKLTAESQPSPSNTSRNAVIADPQPGSFNTTRKQLTPKSNGKKITLPELNKSTVKKPAKLNDAPVFRPTMAEFENPMVYIHKITPSASKYGMCKIVLPDTFKPTCNINKTSNFTSSNQYPGKMFSRWGATTRQFCAIRTHSATQKVRFVRAPLIDGVEVDLANLLLIIKNLGGLMKVLQKELWLEVAEQLNFPKVQTVAKKLDQIYVKYLLPYDTLTDRERKTIVDLVDKEWNKRYKRMLVRAQNPLHKHKQLLGDSSSDDDDDDDDDEDPALVLDEVDDCIVTGRSMTPGTFEKVAGNVMQMHFGKLGRKPTPDEVEAEYWRIVVLGNKHVCVNTAAIDTGEQGYGFSKAKGDVYSKHPWNLKVLSNSAGSILRSLGPVLSVTVPTLHLGMLFSTSCWHRDPHGLPWIEYLHQGPPKIWYGIPDKQCDKFRRAVEALCPAFCQNKSIWLPSDIAMIPPNLLNDHNVTLSKTIQNPGEFIIIFPKAYSCSICTGYTVSESVYFATTSWLATVKNDFQEVRDSFEPTMFSLEQLLISMANDPRVARSTLSFVYRTLQTIVRDEYENRRQLKCRGIVSKDMKHPPKKKTTAWNVREIAECNICRTSLYLSQVTGLIDKKSVYCLQHALRILETPDHLGKDLSSVQMILFYTADALDGIINKLQRRLLMSEPPNTST